MSQSNKFLGGQSDAFATVLPSAGLEHRGEASPASNFETDYSWARDLTDEEWIKFLVGEKSIADHMAPAMPDPAIQRRYVGSDGASALKGAAIFCRHMRSVLKEFGASWGSESRVLDFGVGWGRLYRFLMREVDPARLIGVDIDAFILDIFRKSIPGGTCAQIPFNPPYKFEANTFDSIYLYSVFSHLNQESIIMILNEFARILKPGGFLFFTTLLPAHLDVWARQATEGGQVAAELKAASFDLEKWKRKLGEFGLLHLPPTPGLDSRTPTSYGLTILTETFLKKSNIENQFDIVRFEAPKDMPQAFVALRRRNATALKKRTGQLLAARPETNMISEYCTMDFNAIKWLDKGLQIGQFVLVEEFGADIAVAAEEYPNFILMKGRDCINGYLEVLPRRDQYDDVLELGIMKGGSCVLFNELLKPKRHMAVDISHLKSGLPEFTQHVAAQGRKFQALYRVSQDDEATIVSTYEKTFGTKAEFDLIIDDASHNYAFSLKSFNALFPRMKFGGVYVLEDWGWAHWHGRFQEATHPEYKNPALSNLAINALLGVTGAGGIISEIIAKPNTVFIIRGAAPIRDGFRIEKAFPTRNRAIPFY